MASLIVLLSALTWMRSSLYTNTLLLWQDTVQKSPNKARPHNNLGFILKSSGNIEEAEKHFERAVQLDPDYPEALNNLATIYSSQGRKMDALALLRKAVALGPGQIDARYNLAFLCYQLGLMEDAKREYIVILRRWPYRQEAIFAQQMISMIQNESPRK